MPSVLVQGYMVVHSTILDEFSEEFYGISLHYSDEDREEFVDDLCGPVYHEDGEIYPFGKPVEGKVCLDTYVSVLMSDNGIFIGADNVRFSMREKGGQEED